ncbi:unnamed protein product [Arctia plantaginis]|uniref:Ion transport domain-containing protein n=1 Tax=Arctia plantaginis TaxID=874455 RepID=A0A8S0Z9D5_ARCPL|nr:unnamed protein product [Arctia plantaginis]
MSVYMYGSRKCTENEAKEDRTIRELVGRLSWPNDPRLKGCRKNTRLLDAVGNGDIERISKLLKLDASPNATCHLNCVSACHMAAMMDNESLSMLIAAGAQSFRTDGLGRIPLHLAAWAGRSRQIAVLLDFPEYFQNKVEVKKIPPKIELEIKKMCFKEKHLINVPCDTTKSSTLPEAWSDSMEHDCHQFSKHMPEIESGWTALHLACARVHYSCIQLLLAAGADFNALDVVGRTPLDVMGAAHHLGFAIDIRDFIDTISLIAVAGGIIKDNPFMNGSGTINTLLHTAVELGSKEAVKVLLKAGASAISLNSNGLTPLHICVSRKLKKILQLLANFEHSNQHTQVEVVDAKDKNGETFLGAAVRAQWIDGVRVAVGAGANVFIQANDGNSPFHFAAALGNVQIFETLLTVAKYSIDLPNQEGQTALSIAVAHNHLNIVKLLLSNGASFVNNKPNGDNCNVVHIAAEHGHVKILSFLLNCNAFYEKNLIDDITNVSRRTPIFNAVMNNHLDCVSLLLIHRATIDILLPYKYSTGEVINTTVLHIAAAENYVEIVEVLLEFDSKIINKRNSAGLQPLHEACIHGNRHIIALLIQKGADLSATHPKVKTPIQILMNNLSKPTAFLEEIFDSYITTCGLNIEDKDCKVKIDYRLLLPNALEMKEVKVIKALVNTGNSDNQKTLLHHPMIESFLYLKWKSLLPFFYFIVGLYGCCVVSLNMYVMSVFFELDKNENQDEKKPILFHVFTWKIMTILTGGLVMMQIMFMKIMAGKSYFFFLETWTNFIATILAMFLPTVISTFSPESELMRAVACIAVLLTWLEMMLLLCKFPRWGFYVLMFGKVTAKVLKVLLNFGFLIIGFSICFMIQFRRKPPFETLWASVSKTLVMMTSEYDYSSTINNKNSEDIDTHISILRVIFVAFVILASIVLMNLMIGVAVNDVNNLEKIGNQRRLEKQVDFLSSLEDADKYIRKVLPKRYYKLAIFDENDVVTLSPHKQTCKYYKLFPIHIREALFEKAQSQKKQIDEVCSLGLEKRLDEIQYAIVRQNEMLEQFSKDIMTKIQDHIKSIK